MRNYLDFDNVAMFLFLVLAFLACYFKIGLSSATEFRNEIVPSDGISYLKEGKVILLSDGNYPLAKPSKDSWFYVDDRKYFPLFLVMVEEDSKLKLYPLNVEDESFLPHIGRTLALHILMEFKTTYGENLLTYDEKHDGIPPEISYSKKVFYYLHVENGFGTIERGYLPRDHITFKWYKKPDYVLEEMASLYFLLNRLPSNEQIILNSVK